MSDLSHQQTDLPDPPVSKPTEWGNTGDTSDKEGAILALVFGIIGALVGVGLFVAGQIIPGIIVFCIGFILLGLPLKAKREREETERQALLREQVELLRRIAGSDEQKSAPPPTDPGH